MRLSILSLLFAGAGLLCVPALVVSAAEDEVDESVAGGGFKIATPPLGYPYYTDDPDSARNLVMLGYTRYDTDKLDMHGVSAHLLHRLGRVLHQVRRILCNGPGARC